MFGSDDSGSGETMKSALEIALEKTKDIEPKDDPRRLTDDEKGRVREINRDFDAKIADVELSFAHRLREMVGQHGEQEVQAHMQQFQQEMRGQRDKINAERQLALDAFYKSIGK
jgi:hypothetical protein